MPDDFYRIQKDVELNENQSFGGAVSMKSSSGSVIAMVILLVFFIIGSGYLLIYNVLYISISNDTRFYGLMKTLGTTQKQIKSLVKNQAVKFACIGIPIGILLATAVSFGIVPFVLNEGFARGIFSNESGLGSAPIAAAAAQTKEPVRQGLVSMCGTFIDTIIVCTMTGLAIVMMGSYEAINPVTGKPFEGVEVTNHAFQNGFSFLPSMIPAFILMVCLVFFAFTTILGWNYYGERCMEYLFNSNMKVVMVYRYLYILAVFIGPYMTVSAVWTIADIFNGLMALPNLIALLALSGVISKDTRRYVAKYSRAKRINKLVRA